MFIKSTAFSQKEKNSKVEIWLVLAIQLFCGLIREIYTNNFFNSSLTVNGMKVSKINHIFKDHFIHYII